ncbi:MAG: hypothetical protein IPM79_20050 [Polyangiaceae bacterium]|nr:hypothetical protein [Polyangiaceae bacterium]
MNLRTGFPRAVLRLAVAIGCAASALAASPDLARAQAAEPAAKHRFVLYTEGGRGADVRKLFNDALPDNVDEVTADDFKKALSKRGQTLPFGLTLTLESKRQNMLGRIGNAVADVDAEVALIGYVRKNKFGQQEVMLLAVERDKSEPSIDAVVVLEKDSTKADFEAALRDLVDAWKPKGGGRAAGRRRGRWRGRRRRGQRRRQEARRPGARGGRVAATQERLWSRDHRHQRLVRSGLSLLLVQRRHHDEPAGLQRLRSARRVRAGGGLPVRADRRPHPARHRLHG